MKPKVLIADTDADERDQIKSALAWYDVEAVEAEDADSALKAFLENGPMLVLIDVFLPRRGGIDFLRRLRAVSGGSSVPVIMLSGVKGLSDLRNEALSDLDARAFISKPLRGEQLQSHLTKLFPNRSKACVPVRPINLLTIEPPPMRGELGPLPFVSLFCHLTETRYTGALHLVNEKVQKVVYFVDGEVGFASSNRVSETLGRYMLDAGLISQDVYAEALSEMQAKKRKFGEVLVELGGVDNPTLERALVDHVTQKVASLFAWSTGRYALTESSAAQLLGRGDKNRAIIYKGITDFISMGDIIAVMRNALGLYIIAMKDAKSLIEEFGLVGDESLFLLGADRLPGKTLQQALGFSSHEKEVRLLFTLFALGGYALSESPECNYFAEGQEAEELRKIQAARLFLSNLKNQNHFVALGVGLDADDAKVKQAFQEKAKLYHPDVVPATDPQEVRSLYSEIFLRLRESFDAIKGEQDRKRYLKLISAPAAEEKMMEGDRLLNAETYFQQGMSFVRKRKWAEAIAPLEEAVKYNPDEAEYAVQCGIAKMNLKSEGKAPSMEEAKAHFLRAVELDRRSAEPYYRLGLLHKLIGEDEKAFEYFQNALVKDPGNVQARMELRLISTRKSHIGKGVVIPGHRKKS